MEIRLTRTDTDMQTLRTALRSIARRDFDHLYAGARGLVGDHLLKLGETPSVDAFRLAAVSNTVEVFKHDPPLAACASATICLLTQWLVSATKRLSRPETRASARLALLLPLAWRERLVLL